VDKRKAISILADLPKLPAEYGEYASFVTVREPWLHAKPSSQLARAIDAFGGVRGAGDALARHWAGECVA
jgi:hypothetical protein